MAIKKNHKTEFYTHVIKRDEEVQEENNVSTTNKTLYSVLNNKVDYSHYGSYDDTSVYDTFRGKRNYEKFINSLRETAEQTQSSYNIKKEQVENYDDLYYEEEEEQFDLEDFDLEDLGLSYSAQPTMVSSSNEPKVEETFKTAYNEPEQVEEETNVQDDEDETENVEQFESTNDSNYEEEIIKEDDEVEETLEVEEQVSEPEPIVEPTPIVTKPVEEQPVVKPHKKHRYVYPPTSLLVHGNGTSNADQELAESQQKIINEVLEQNGIDAQAVKYIFAPSVIVHLIQFNNQKQPVKVLQSLEDNLAMYLETSNLNIQTPVPNMRFCSIEVPRSMDKRQPVYFGDMVDGQAFKNTTYEAPVVLGRDNFNHDIIIDLREMPHGLCAGATKSGKSVCLNTIIASLLYKFTPDDLRLILIDPKVVEFSKYTDIPHLAMPVITSEELFEPALQWMFDEMERRYQVLNKYGCVDLKDLNEELEDRGEQKLPLIIMIMDEFTDWVLAANQNIITLLTRLCGKARAAGIHIILSALRPSADVIKGTIKNNISTRFAFHVSGASDSVVVLGHGGAEKLLGRGDMILRHTGYDDQRLQACLVTNKELINLCDFLRSNTETEYIITTEELKQKGNKVANSSQSGIPSTTGVNDDLFKEVALYIVRNDNASLNNVSQVYKTGFNRMNAMFAEYERLGIISKGVHGAKRSVQVTEDELDEILENL